ncbi:hypothetical protein K1719_023328 [Acacia pycnantha]|nr:hypothetical protein K1719_023328 [Acacia pycnantha]
MVLSFGVIVLRKALCGSLDSSLYSRVPFSGMNLRLRVGRFRIKPPYGYCPKFTAACSAEDTQMNLVPVSISSPRFCILNHVGSSFLSP